MVVQSNHGAETSMFQKGLYCPWLLGHSVFYLLVVDIKKKLDHQDWISYDDLFERIKGFRKSCLLKDCSISLSFFFLGKQRLRSSEKHPRHRYTVGTSIPHGQPDRTSTPPPYWKRCEWLWANTNKWECCCFLVAIFNWVQCVGDIYLECWYCYSYNHWEKPKKPTTYIYLWS